jgi:ubiquinone/menaquinone biosynthesis C-methylase UbiE
VVDALENEDKSTARSRSEGSTERDFYEEIAKRVPSPELIFLNYGYADAAGEPRRWIAATDQRYKHHLSLVKHVMAGVELARQTVLEVGSGRGGNCYYLARYTQAKKVYGIDQCEANVRFCRKVHRLPRATFLRGDAQQLPFRSATFDVVLNLESSHCYPHFERFLAEVHRVLKSNGTFCYADLWFLEFLELDWEARKKALNAAPFVLLSEEDISEPVFQALTSKDGFVETIRAMSNETNREFVEEVVLKLKLVRLMLAASRFSYRVWRFRKP